MITRRRLILAICGVGLPLGWWIVTLSLLQPGPRAAAQRQIETPLVVAQESDAPQRRAATPAVRPGDPVGDALYSMQHWTRFPTEDVFTGRLRDQLDEGECADVLEFLARVEEGPQRVLQRSHRSVLVEVSSRPAPGEPERLGWLTLEAGQDFWRIEHVRLRPAPPVDAER